MLRRTFLASASAMALTSAAVAADLGTRPPPPVFLPPPPIFSWTGLYLGVNAGYTWSNNNLVDTDASPGGCNPAFPGCAVTPNLSVTSASLATFSLPAKTDGFIGGGQIGYNYQFNNSFVAGIEADLQGIAGAHASSSFDNTLANPNFTTNSIDQSVAVSKSLDYLGTIRGRLGFLITPTLLVYGTGGLAYGQTNSSANITQFVEDAGTALAPNPYSSFGGLSNSRVGWTAGGGGEWLFAPNWSLKVEYLYYDLGNVTYSLSPLVTFGQPGTAAPGSAFLSAFPQSTTHFRGNIVRAGLNYHFNLGGPAPVVAKY
ncbi:MAG: outer membrane beta-barrel protein [Methylocella sp.]